LMLAFLALAGGNAYGQTSAGVAQYLEIPGEVEDGMVICTSSEGSLPCQAGYDPNMVGVVTLVSAITIGEATASAEAGPLAGTYPVTNSGQAYVLVSDENGEIKKGDFITSSTQPGVAVKALKSGFVLGTALEDFHEADDDGNTRILASIAIKPAVLSTRAGANLIEMIRQGLEAAFLTPLSALRYVVAGILVIISVTYGFFHFGRLARSGVEAVGRNPLASRAIQMSVLFNVILTIGVIGVGVGIAFLVLTL